MSQQTRDDLIGFTLTAALAAFLILINVLM
jgi:hypothetical protein